MSGVTGARHELGPELPGLLERLRRHTSAPLAVGFGISSPAQAGLVADLADGVIVGSTLIELIARTGGGAESRAAVTALLAKMSAAIGGGDAGDQRISRT